MVLTSRKMGVYIIHVLLSYLFLRQIKAEFKLVVLHTNDMHARYEATNRRGYPCSEEDLRDNHCYGGFPRIRQLSNEIKEQAIAEGKSVLFVNAGDTFLGSNYHSAFIGDIAADMMNRLEFDIMCLGNHEFDDGVENLLPFLEKAKFPIVCCNIDTSLEPILNATEKLFPSYILDVNGTKIGVVGYITPRTKTIARPGKVQLLDEIECTKREIEKLKAAGVKIIMALGHSGIEKDIEVVQNITDVDFVVGGHSHTFLFTGEPPVGLVDRWSGESYPKVIMRDIEGQVQQAVPIAHAHAFTRFLGKLELTFNDDGEIISYGGNPILLDATIKEDEEVNKELMKWKSQLIEKEKEYIGKTDVELEGDNVPCRLEECNMGDLITDAFIEYNKKNGFNDSGIAIYPAGGIRCGINVTSVGGVIKSGDLMRVLPFRDRLHQTQLLGKYFRKALEHSVEMLGQKYRRGEFLQFSGVKVVYNISKPAGNRVVSVLVQPAYHADFVSLEDETIYNILLPDCLSYGADGYSMFPDYSLSKTEIAKSIYELVKEFINETSPVNIEKSDRITIIKSLELQSTA